MFTVLIVFVILVAGVVLSILLTPFTIVVDSRKAEYTLCLQGIFTCSLINKEGTLIARIKLPFYRRDYDLVQTVMHGAIGPKPNKKPKGRRRNSLGFSPKITKVKAIRIWKTFRVKEFYLNVDFGNSMLNGMIYPLFHLLQSKGYQVRCNFLDQRDLTLVIQNRLAKILWAIFYKT